MPLFLLLLLAAAGFAQAGEDARTLLREVAEASRNLTTYRAEGRIALDVDFGFKEKLDLTFRVAKQSPQRIRVEITGGEEWATGLSYTSVCDGSSGWVYFDRSKKFEKVGGEKTRENRCTLGMLTNFDHVADEVRSAVIAGTGTAEFEGRSHPCVIVKAQYRVINDVMILPGAVTKIGRVSRTMCIDRQRKLILTDHLEADLDAGPDSGQIIETITYDRIERNPDLPPDLFVFRPPAGATLIKPPARPLARIAEAAKARPAPVTFAAAEPILRVEPEYTQEAWDEGIQGTVSLDVKTGPDGTVLDVKVLEPIGYGLDEKAVECARKWRFSPALNAGRPVAGGARIEIHFSLPDKRPDRPTVGPVSRPVRAPRLPVVKLKAPTDLDNFFYLVANNFKTPALCERIDPMADGGGGGFSQRGYQIRTLQSRCFSELAGALHDATLCDRVQPVRTDGLDGSRIDKAYCRDHLDLSSGIAIVDPHHMQPFVDFMRKLGYGDGQVAEFYYEHYYGNSPTASAYQWFLKDRKFLDCVHTGPSYAESRAQAKIRPAHAAEYLYQMVAVDTKDAALCAKISPNATFIDLGGKTALLQSQCYVTLAFNGRNETLCDRLPRLGMFPHADNPYYCRENCHKTVAIYSRPDMRKGDPGYLATRFPKSTDLQIALKRIGYNHDPTAILVHTPTPKDYEEFFFELAHRASQQERDRFVQQVMTLR